MKDVAETYSQRDALLALPTNRLLSGKGALAFSAQFVVDCVERLIKCPICIVEESCRVVAMSSRAWQSLYGLGGLRVRKGRLESERAHVGRKLQLAVQAAVQVVLDGAGVELDPRPARSIGIPGPDGHIQSMVQASFFGRLNGRPLVALVIVDLVARSGAGRASIAALFNLTQREAELCEHFARGLDIETIALRMNISPNTARVHLRRVLEKTNSKNQAQLARALALLDWVTADAPSNDRTGGRIPT